MPVIKGHLVTEWPSRPQRLILSELLCDVKSVERWYDRVYEFNEQFRGDEYPPKRFTGIMSRIDKVLKETETETKGP